MNDIDWFKFEKKDLDFPFYKKNPYIPKWGWIVLFFALILGFIFTLGESIQYGIISLIILLVPVLYFLNWDYKAIFQKPTLKEVALAIALFVGYMIYATLVGMGLEQLGITISGAGDLSINYMIYPKLLFAMMSEELIKFIPFMFFMRLIYKFSENRKAAIIISMLLVMMSFGMLHSYSLITLIFALLVQGFGSIFEFYGYIKTKNLLIPYITHLCTDVFIMSLTLFGPA